MTETVPLYRDLNAALNDHMYTTQNHIMSGYRREGIAGYCHPSPSPGTVPLYRYFNSGITDHFYTTDATEIGTTTPGADGLHGYRSEGVACYVFSH